MQKSSPPQTLTELIKLDWLIFEHGKLLKQAKNILIKLTESGADTFEQLGRIVTIQKQQNEFIAARQDLRAYFTKSRPGPARAIPTYAASQPAQRKAEATSSQPKPLLTRLWA